MKNESIFKLEDLSIRVDGLASMMTAIRDCFIEGSNSPQNYTGAVDLLSELMDDAKEELNAIVKEMWDEIKHMKKTPQ